MRESEQRISDKQQQKEKIRKHYEKAEKLKCKGDPCKAPAASL